MPPAVEAMIFDDALRARLQRIAQLEDGPPAFPPGDDAAAARLAKAEVLLTSWGCPPLDASLLDRAPKLRFVAHAAGSVKSFATPALWARGIRVSSAAAANAVPVAEYTLAAILLAGKRAFDVREEYRTERKGLWGHDRPRMGNLGKKVGLVGASRVGRALIEMLRPFDIEVAVTDPYLSDAEARELGVAKRELRPLLEESDVVSLHAPALESTHHMIGAAELSAMGDGTTLVNTARGALVDHDALEKELVSGRISAVIDTTEPEVLPADSPLYGLPNVFLTPHIAGALGNETLRMSSLALDEIERFHAGESLQHEVTERDMERVA
ncbi:MAG: hydroxyacid dehydrogenase [Myxococcota bacterium]